MIILQWNEVTAVGGHLTFPTISAAPPVHVSKLVTRKYSVITDAFATSTACCDLDLRILIRSSVGATEHSLQVSSRLLKPFMRYRGNKICPDGRTRWTDSRKTCLRPQCPVTEVKKTAQQLKEAIIFEVNKPLKWNFSFTKSWKIGNSLKRLKFYHRIFTIDKNIELCVLEGGGIFNHPIGRCVIYL